MNSFTVTAVGNLAKNPELAVKGDTTYTRLCLVGNDYAGKDDRGNVREAVTSVWFVAFESLGEAIAKNARKGDQLILQAQIRANIWTDKEGEKQYDHSFVVQNFRYAGWSVMQRAFQEGWAFASSGTRALDITSVCYPGGNSPPCVGSW